MNKEKPKGWFGQPSIIRSLDKKFGEEAMKHRLVLTPGTPRFIAMRVTNEEGKLPMKVQRQYTEVELGPYYISPSIADLTFAMQ